MAVLSLDRLSKRFGARLAVDAVSFEVREREVFGLLGPNGSGKSTILRSSPATSTQAPGPSGLPASTSCARPAPPASASAMCRRIRRSTAHMRVVEYPRIHGAAARDRRARALDRAIDAAVERLALGSVRNVIIERLSRGYRQRVSLAQAVLHKPELLVLDEPSNGLDPRQIIELRGLLRDLAQDCAVLVTSHILAEIERTADRAAILLDGRLLTVEQIAHETVAAPAASPLEALFLDLTQAKAIAMSQVATLVGKEVRTLFTSPIAYAVIAVFLVLSGYTFTVSLIVSQAGDPGAHLLPGGRPVDPAGAAHHDAPVRRGAAQRHARAAADGAAAGDRHRCSRSSSPAWRCWRR